MLKLIIEQRIQWMFSRLHMKKSWQCIGLSWFWRRLKRSKAKIQTVATGMASGYIAAVLESLAKTDLVLDRFSIVNSLIAFDSEFCS